jgi:hypothetical protein
MQPKKKPDPTRQDQLINDLKTQGDRIPADFNSCEIRGHEYTDVDSPDEFQITSLHYIPIAGDPGQRNIRQSVFIFSYTNTRSGQTEKFYSPIIPKDETTLSFYLDRQKQTTLYVDKTNRERYYFDLDFLKD